MKKLIMVLMCVILCVMPIAALAEEAAPHVTVDLTGVIISMMVLVFDLILGWVAKEYLPSLKAWLDERTTSEQQQRIYDLIEKLVNAAEQMIGAGMGNEKLKYVVNELRRRGISVDVDMIEAAVKEMNDKALIAMGEALDISELLADEAPEGSDVVGDKEGA